MTAEGTLQDMPPAHSDPLEDEIPASRWPTVIGVISIVYAIGGLTCAGLQIGWFSTMNLLPEMYRGGMSFPVGVRIGSIALGVVLVVLGIMLLAGGIGLIRRRRSSVIVLRRWALLRMVMLLVGAIFAVVTGPAQVQAQRGALEYQARMMAEADMPPPPEKTDEQLWRGVMIPAGAMSMIVAIYPLFLVFYLCRKKVDREVAEWR